MCRIMANLKPQLLILVLISVFSLVLAQDDTPECGVSSSTKVAEKANDDTASLLVSLMLVTRLVHKVSGLVYVKTTNISRT